MIGEKGNNNEKTKHFTGDLLRSGRDVLGPLKSLEANPSVLGLVAFKDSGDDIAISKLSRLVHLIS